MNAPSCNDRPSDGSLSIPRRSLLLHMEVNFFFGTRAGGKLFQVLDKRFQVAEAGHVCACGLRRFVHGGGISLAISRLER